MNVTKKWLRLKMVEKMLEMLPTGGKFAEGNVEIEVLDWGFGVSVGDHYEELKSPTDVCEYLFGK